MTTENVRVHFSKLAEQGVWASLYTPGQKIDSETWSFIIRARRVAELLQRSGTTLGGVVDVGCGTAPVARSVVAMGAQYIGLDFSPEMVAEARENVADLVQKGEADLRVGDVTAIDLPDASADAVLAMGVLEYLTRPAVDQATSEMRRILRPGGVAILTIPKRLHWGAIVSRVFGPLRRLTQGPSKRLKLNIAEQFKRLYLTPAELDIACRRAGLRKVNERHYNVQPLAGPIAARIPRMSYFVNRPFEPLARVRLLTFLATGYIGMYRRDV